ncbi:DUF2339 domain-containing protein [Nocardia sp. NPDC005978]|uniref:DUF2339 domain-containing protein n=1 Tax=Nocardia sp. NPDC005978 TaxID=3156725 RepID=UPI0033B72A75
MNTAIDPRLIARLSTEFTSLSDHMSTLGRDLEVLRGQLVADRAGQTAQDAAATTVFAPHQPVTPPAPIPVAGGPVPPPGEWARPAPAAAAASSGVPSSTGASFETAAAEPIPQGGSGTPGAVPAGPGQAGAGASAWQVPAGVPVPPPGGALPPQFGGAPRYPGAPAGMPGQTRAGWMGGPPRAGAVGQPVYGAMPPPQGPRRVPPRPVRTPWWQREGVVSRLLAVAGVGVTLIGVVMLLVLAAQAGIFGPVPRVVAGAVFSAALVGVAVRVHGRAGGQVGAVALAATGIAGGYLTVVAVTAVYGWLHPVIGYGVALGIAAGGVALAMHWRAQALAVLVVLGAALLSPSVATGIALLVFLIVLQLAAVPVQVVRDWPWLHLVRTLPAALATFFAVAVAALGDAARGHRYEVLAAAVAVAVIGLAGALVVLRKRAGDLTASLAFAVATVPLLAAPAMFERRTSVIVAAVFATVLLLVAALPWAAKLAERVRIPGHLAAVAAVAGSCALLEACVGVTRVQTLPIALYLAALGFLAVAGQQRSRLATGLGAAFAVIGTLAFLERVNPSTLATQADAERYLGISTALAAVAALAVLAAGFRCARRLGLADSESDASALGVVGGIAALYAVTALTVSAGVATGSRDGFLAGHGIATVIWMAAATTALLYGLRRLARTPQAAKVALAAGLLVTAASLAKLFLFDLATLDGLVRAGAFLVVGVLLLLAGTRYARAFAESAQSTPSAT